MIMLDYHIDVFWANLRAVIYTALHWNTRVYIENVWIERYNPEYPARTEFKEKITFIGVVSGSLLNDDLQVHRIYYGNPRFEPASFLKNK